MLLYPDQIILIVHAIPFEPTLFQRHLLPCPSLPIKEIFQMYNFQSLQVLQFSLQIAQPLLPLLKLLHS